MVHQESRGFLDGDNTFGKFVQNLSCDHMHDIRISKIIFYVKEKVLENRTFKLVKLRSVKLKVEPR